MNILASFKTDFGVTFEHFRHFIKNCESWTKIEINIKVGKAITPDFDMYSYNRHYYYGYNYGPYYGYDGYSYSPYYSPPHVFRGGQYNR